MLFVDVEFIILTLLFMFSSELNLNLKKYLILSNTLDILKGGRQGCNYIRKFVKHGVEFYT